MTTAWKFSIDFDTHPDYSKDELRRMVAETACEADGRIILRGDDIYLTKFDDAFSFRMRAGHLVDGGRKSRLKA